MVYISEPPKDRYIDIAFGVAVYLMAVGYGVWTFLNPPATIQGSLGVWAVRYTALFSVIGSVACIVGVLLRKPMIEGSALWISIIGYVVYMIAVWGLFLTETSTRGSQAFALTALILSHSWRGFRLNRKTQGLVKLRELELRATERLEGEL